MRIRVTNTALLHDLSDFLTRAECVAVQASADTIEVYVPQVQDDRQARRELSLYVATWRARNPRAQVEIIA